MPAVNLFQTEFTPRISVLHLHAGIGKNGQREGHRILYLIKNKWKQLQYNLEIDMSGPKTYEFFGVV